MLPGVRKTIVAFTRNKAAAGGGSKWEMPPARRGGRAAEAVGNNMRHGLTLARVLEDEALRTRFAAFLQGEYSSENLAFHQSASAFLEANGATRERRSTGGQTAECRKTIFEEDENVEATMLINHFVKPGAAEEINLPSGMRASLIEAVRSSNEEELVEQMRAAMSEVFKLMERDSFSRFVLTLSGDANAPSRLGGFGDSLPMTRSAVSDVTANLRFTSV